MFKSIDLQRAVKNQYGSSASLGLKGYHLWDWYATRGNKQYSIDLQKACIEQYGSGYYPVSIGVHAYDWKAFNFNDAKSKFIPVVIVSPEHFKDMGGVISATRHFKSVLNYCQNWFKEKIGETFQYIDPLVIYSLNNVEQWAEFSELSRTSSGQSEGRRAFIENSYKNVLARLEIVDHVNYISAPYVGNRPDLDQGMATYSFNKKGFVALTPDVTCSELTTGMLSGSIHEIGHSLGLDHSSNAQSIMYNAQVPGAILTPGEKEILKSSTFIT